MKILKYVWAMTFMLAFCVNALAEELTSAQKTFRSNIMQFLKEEGFAPSIDTDDNSVLFKKEGVSHWIYVKGGNPFYIQIQIAGFNCEDSDKNLVLEAINEGNKKARCAKAWLSGNSLIIDVEMFCHSAEEFRYAFYSCLDELENIKSVIADYYEENSTSSVPFTITSVKFANTDYDRNIINDYGNIIYSSQSMYLSPKLYINAEVSGTYDIYVKCYWPSGTLSTGSTSPSGYSFKRSITVTKGSGSYELAGWGGKAGYWSAGQYRFEFYYEGDLIGSGTCVVK